VSIILDGTSPSLNPKALQFTLVSHDPEAPGAMSLSFFNWRTGLYETVKSTVSAVTDTFLSCSATGDLSRFVRADGAVRAEITSASYHSKTARIWRDYFDQAVWDVIP
ncbi:MAG TPA: hypothetical protein VMI31_17040, partial [Fimbriimonadaceae bacterium]|nr:hypothetical protein [Fimbriimonadaceae bacterium]